MTEFFEGTPGSGKSLLASAKIDDLLRTTDRYIIANFDIDLRIVAAKSKRNDYDHIRDHFIYLENEKLTPDVLYDHCWNHHEFKSITINDVEQLQCPEHQTLLVIDEAEIMFNCRAWNQKDRPEWCRFFSMHRHYGYDGILIAPDKSFVDKQILAVIENHVLFMNLRNWNFLGRCIAMVFGGSLFIAKHYWRWSKECVNSNVFPYNKRLGSLYNTSGHFLANRQACGSAAGLTSGEKVVEGVISS